MSENVNILVGQSGGPTCAINSSLAGVVETAHIKFPGSTVYGMLNGIQGLLKERYVDMADQVKSSLDIELLKRTPSSFLGSCRYKLPEIEQDEETYKKIFEIIDKLEVGHFFYIGGNDSMDTIKKLSDYAAKIGHKCHFIGVPKTVDNDLMITDHCPGFGSAAKFIGTVTKELIKDALVYERKTVTIVEVMGRNAGWLTGATALSRGSDCAGPDMIYLPEKAFDTDAFLDKVEKLLQERNSLLIAVSEGIKLADGTFVCDIAKSSEGTDAFGHTQLAGAAKVLADMVKSKFGCTTRAVEINTLQRCASHFASAADLDEAYAAGAAAVRKSFGGETAKMIVLNRISDEPYLCGTDAYDINCISNLEKVVPDGWISDEGTNVTEEFIDYLRPLIRGEVTPYMDDGIPRHLSLKI
ncbi:MAG: 6-phosphofructokinase [Lachnospiraceae bacterium]|nr:6-phosphofructokinase [Lachnospiraceae bacterium]